MNDKIILRGSSGLVALGLLSGCFEAGDLERDPSGDNTTRAATESRSPGTGTISNPAGEFYVGPAVDGPELSSPLEVGDRVGGSEVVGLSGDERCQTVILSDAPRWACSDEQLERVQVTVPTASVVAPANTDSSEQIQLHPTDCDALAELRRDQLRTDLRAQLGDTLDRLLTSYCLPQRRIAYLSEGLWVSVCGFHSPPPPPTQLPGAPNYSGAPTDAPYAANPVAMPGLGPSPTTAQAPVTPQNGPDSAAPNLVDGAEDYSTTNTQVLGVDEADFVKNDGGTIYVLARNELVVFDAWPVSDLEEVARLPIEGEPRRLFLHEDRLVVYSRIGAAGTAAATCTYGYACRSSSEGGSTKAFVYDVSQPAEPVLLKSYAYSGAYLSSRRIGNSVYTVVHDSARPVQVPVTDLSLNALELNVLEAQYAEKLDSIDRAVDEVATEDFLPWLNEASTDRSVSSAKPTCDHALVSGASLGTSFISIVGFDLARLDEPRGTLVASKPGFVYASADALYLTVDGVDGADSTFSSYAGYANRAAEDRSTVHKFALAATEAIYAGSQAIHGHVLNQFSMDEHDGVLRVATSSGWVPDPATSSNVTTLAERGGEFTVLGELRGLAPTEDIRSVRFDGDRGFVVTFKKTDPLYAIGLADPLQPTVLGELKIPGFSTYMHLLDADHLLAVGFDADDHGSFAYFQGIQVQIFDVTDLTDPRLLHKTVLGTRGSGSEALMNHLAFNYFPSRGVLALPATVCGGGDDGRYADTLQFSGLVVFDVSVQNGISERGRLPFVDLQNEPTIGAAGNCSQWWTNSSSLVKRSIFLDDYAIALSETWLKAAALDDLADVLRSVPLTSGSGSR